MGSVHASLSQDQVEARRTEQNGALYRVDALGIEGHIDWIYSTPVGNEELKRSPRGDDVAVDIDWTSVDVD